MESWCYSGTGESTHARVALHFGVLWRQGGIAVGTRGRDSGGCCMLLRCCPSLAPRHSFSWPSLWLSWVPSAVVTAGVGERPDHFLSTNPVKLPLRNLERGFWTTGR